MRWDSGDSCEFPSSAAKHFVADVAVDERGDEVQDTRLCAELVEARPADRAHLTRRQFAGEFSLETLELSFDVALECR